MSDRALVRNTSDRSQVRKAKKTERQLKVEYDENLKAVLGTYAGRFVLWTIAEYAGPMTQSYRGEATHDTSFQEGKRSGGLRLIAEVCRVSLASYHLMQTEAASRAANVQEPPPKTDEPFPLSEGTEPVEADDGY